MRKFGIREIEIQHGKFHIDGGGRKEEGRRREEEGRREDEGRREEGGRKKVILREVIFKEIAI